MKNVYCRLLSFLLVSHLTAQEIRGNIKTAHESNGTRYQIGVSYKW